MRALRKETIYIYIHMYNRGRKEQYCVRSTSINATTMAEHSGGGFAVRAQVNIQGVSFHSVCYTADTNTSRRGRWRH